MITIITPCYRPNNLLCIFKSIHFNKITEWIIVYDTTNNRKYERQFNKEPKIREVECCDPGISGNSQRNYGVSLVSEGFIYFLDDDNIMHPNFWNIINTININHFYTFDQRFFVTDQFRTETNFIFKGGQPVLRKIDTSMFIVPRTMCIPWDIGVYYADGIFIEEVARKNPDKHIYIPEIAGYYNFITDSITPPVSGLQNVFFISDTEPLFYPKIEKHYTWIPVIGELSYERLSKLYQIYKPLAYFTYASTTSILNKTFNLRKRWIHLSEIPEKLDVCPTIFTSMFPGAHTYDSAWPLMSIITTTFNSGKKILRPLQSLQAQTYTNWEWIIWDDSKDDVTYKQLLDLQEKDLRIRVFKAPMHSGYIGEMKRLAGSLVTGEYIIEIDHDDDFHPNLLQWIHDAGDAYPDAGFFYTDCAELTEETYEPAVYGESFGLGYEMHIFRWSKFHNCYIPSANAAPPNGLTLSHIVGVPNHARIWRTSVYDKIGRHNQLLSVADDYDLILRSYLEAPFCHIQACAYYQYRNRDGNFTFHRNALIQHNVKHIYNHYKDRLPVHDWSVQFKEQWRVDAVRHPETHKKWIPLELQLDVTIALTNPTLDELQEEINEQKASGKRFHIFVVGPLPPISDEFKQFVSWWDMKSTDLAERQEYVKRFLHVSGELIFKGKWKSNMIDSSYPFLSVDYYLELSNCKIIKYGDMITEGSDIIFINTGLLNIYIPILLGLNYPFKLITACNDDLCVPYFSYPPDDNIKQLHDSLIDCPFLTTWYTKNASILHPKIVALPLGPKMQWNSCDFFGESKENILKIYNKYYKNPNKMFKSEKPNLLYINMDNNTTNKPFYSDHAGIRNTATASLELNGFFSQTNKSVEDYISELMSYKFCISPPGAGIDVHRTWESLMVGTIPICISSPLDYIYKDLPVVLVDDYSVVTKEFLEDKYSILKDKEYDFSCIYGDYWKSLIN